MMEKQKLNIIKKIIWLRLAQVLINERYKNGDFKVVEKQAKNILSLPINENLDGKHIKYICKIINSFFE